MIRAKSQDKLNDLEFRLEIRTRSIYPKINTQDKLKVIIGVTISLDKLKEENQCINSRFKMINQQLVFFSFHKASLYRAKYKLLECLHIQ